MALTAAEKMRRRREKLKNEGRYEDFKAKHRENVKRNRQKKKEEIAKLPSKKKKVIIEEQRKKKRQEMARYRKLHALKEANKLQSPETPPFKSASSFGKATSRAKAALPKSPRKRKCVIKKLFDTFLDSDADGNVKSSGQKKEHQSALKPDLIASVTNFYERDDISRQAPGIKDVKTIRNKDGTKEKIQVRHLYTSILETHAQFCEEYGSKIIGVSKFAELRPKHVLLNNKLPHNVCLCKYHENYISAINAFHKNVPNFPSYNNDFIQSNIICKNSTEKCWNRTCQKCPNFLENKLNNVLKNVDVSPVVTWTVWKELDQTLCKTVEEGSAQELSEHIIALTPQFLEHTYVKRMQAESYQLDREARGKEDFDPKVSTIQVDFSEKYTCIAQDEIQSFHWVKPQVTLFTVSLWHSGKQHPLVLASDVPVQNKDTVFAYMDKALELPEYVKQVNVCSDGPHSQFKNWYTAAALQTLEKNHHKSITWNFFATSHGKGPVDGIGGAIKRVVRNCVLRRETVVFNAYQFAETASKYSSVKVIEMTDEDINKRNSKMNLMSLFEHAAPIPGIAKAHHIRIEKGKPKTFILTRDFNISKPQEEIENVSKKTYYEEVYGSDSTDDESASDQGNSDSVSETDSEMEHLALKQPSIQDIKPGTYVLVEFEVTPVTKYRYVAVCQSEVEDDGDIKIMCLNQVGNKGVRFKVDEKDVSYIQFNQIQYILPVPKLVMQGRRVYYEFDAAVDVYEKASK